MDVADLPAVLRRRYVAIILCLCAGFGGAWTLTENTEPVYRSSTRLLVNIPAVDRVQEALVGVQLSQTLLASYAAVATSRTAAAEISEALDGQLPPSAVQSQLQAVSVPDTLLLEISAVDKDPAVAQRLADAAGAEFLETVRDLERGRTAPIEPSIVDPASRPSAPISPRPAANLTLGTLLGLIVGVGLAFLLERLDQSVRGPADLVGLSGRPLLGIVPHRKDFAAHPLVTREEAGTGMAESYRVLRTSVRFVDLDRPLKTLLVTSPMPGDGKTATATNLAVAMAQSGDRVLLVDADLRRSRVPDVMGVPREPGLTSVVLGDAREAEAICGVSDRLFVLPPGPLPPNPSELLGSKQMADLVNRLGASADVIVFDGPPIVPVTDGQVLSNVVDGVILVARDGRTARDSITEAMRRLELVGANVVGCVLNGAASSGDYAEEYQYSSLYAGDRSALKQRFRRARQPAATTD